MDTTLVRGYKLGSWEYKIPLNLIEEFELMYTPLKEGSNDDDSIINSINIKYKDYKISSGTTSVPKGLKKDLLYLHKK